MEPPQPIIGSSPAVTRLRESIRVVGASDARVLISGESGTGKELVAAWIHESSRRRVQPFVAMNCAGIPETLLESELFGHVRGSFTGAYKDRAGKIEQAHLGTLFLDEIGEMTPRMQGMLLRFLETGEVQKVGSDKSAKLSNIRVVSATHRLLPKMVEEGTFREDLYYRLNVINVVVPPLRDREHDVRELSQYFLAMYRATDEDVVAREFTDAALDRLSSHAWRGNIRELQNTIRRLSVMVKRPVIDCHDLPAETFSEFRAKPDVTVSVRLADIPAGMSVLEAVERQLLKDTMEELGQQNRAARRLRISPRVINYKLRIHGMRKRRMTPNETHELESEAN